MSGIKFVFLAFSIVLFWSCSDELKTIDFITAEDMSSSSVEVSSSSSSSDAESSSSVEVSSSSSEELSSSSSEDDSSSSSSVLSGPCDDFDPSEQREHYGIMKNQFCDERDGRRYVYVNIGGQNWMAENLNYITENSFCYNDPSGGDSQGLCVDHGRLYQWETALEVCPEGWHLPSNAERTALITAANPYAGVKLRTTTNWDSGQGSFKGSDNFGFSARGGGMHNSNGTFVNIAKIGYWWTNEQRGYLSIEYNKQPAISSSGIAGSGYSVRCVQDGN